MNQENKNICYYYTYDSFLGKYSIVEEDNKIIHVKLKFKDVSSLILKNSGSRSQEESQLILKETPLIQEAHRQLDLYFSGKLTKFDFEKMPCNPKGTAFQKKVWNKLLDIPYGQVCSYKDIAIKIGCEKGARAVGMANHRNPIPVIFPCHRVIGKNGKMVGFGGGIDLKEKLLQIENYKKFLSK